MDYSKLPEDIMEKIAREHLGSLGQLIAFSGVCKSWRSLALKSAGGGNRPCLPGLLISGAKSCRWDDSESDPSIYCGPEHKFSPLTLFPLILFHWAITTTTRELPQIKLPHFPSRSKISRLLEEGCRKMSCHLGRNVQRDHYLASADGWLLVMKPRRSPCRCCCHPLNFYLLNPITGAAVDLPPLTPPTDPYPYELEPSLTPVAPDITKAILSSPPGGDDSICHVIILFQSTPNRPPLVAWYKVRGGGGGGGGGWELARSLPWGKLENNFNCYRKVLMDAVYFDGKLYMLIGYHLYIVHNLIAADDAAGVITVKAYPFLSADDLKEEFRRIISKETAFRLARSYEGDDGGHSLLLIRRQYPSGDSEYYLSLEWLFNVYKLVITGSGDGTGEEDYHWADVVKLDGYALFVDCHRSFAVGSSSSRGSGVGENTIYYVCDRGYGVYSNDNDSGIFHHLDSMGFRNCRSFWFLPMPWDIFKTHLPGKLINQNHGEKEIQEVVEDDDLDGGGDDVCTVLKRHKPRRRRKKKKRAGSWSQTVTTFLRYYALLTIPLSLALLLFWLFKG